MRATATGLNPESTNASHWSLRALSGVDGCSNAHNVEQKTFDFNGCGSLEIPVARKQPEQRTIYLFSLTRNTSKNFPPLSGPPRTGKDQPPVPVADPPAAAPTSAATTPVRKSPLSGNQ